MGNLYIPLPKVGPRVVNDGGQDVLRLDKTGALVVTGAHGYNQESVLRGQVYTASVKSATVTVTTDISPLPATTGRALLAIYNPPNSGKNLVVLKAGVSTVSGTPGGPFYLDVVPPGATIALTNVTANQPVNNMTFTPGGGVAKVFAAAVPVNSVVATMLRPLGGPAAVAAGAGPYQVDELIDGAIIVPQGGMLVISAHAVGTTHVVSGYITFEEVVAN